MTALDVLSLQVGQALLAHQWRLTTAESCTGGGIAQAITEISGSSAWFEQGFVTYSNTAKMQLLGVPNELLEKHGAVSEETVYAMAKGALDVSGSEFAIAVSGIAGPTGGTSTKPVGMVCFGFADITGWHEEVTQIFQGDRAEVRQQAIEFALKIVLNQLQTE